MQDIITYLFKSSVCIAIFWLVYRICFRKETFFRYIRFYLLSGMIAAVVIPLLHFTYDVKVQHGNGVELLHKLNEVQPETIYTGYDMWAIPGIIYLTGVIIMVAGRIADYKKFYGIYKRGVKSVESAYISIESPEATTPFSLMKYIVINSSGISATEKNIILKHEKSHIRQKHWLDLIVCEMFTVFQWFNPLAWKYIDCIKENHEFMVDKDLLDSGIPIITYREVLVNQIFGRPVFTFSNSFIYSKNSKRLFMMTKAKSSVWKKVSILALLPLFSVFVLVSAEPQQVEDTAITKITVIGSKEGKAAPIYIVDGKERTEDEVKNIPPVHIESMHVYTDKDAINKYGDKGKNGVIFIKMQPEAGGKSVVTTGSESLLIIVDGKISTLEDFNALSPETIESVNVINDAPEETYGEAARNGVLIVKTKKQK